jgi:hypothetical protein
MSRLATYTVLASGITLLAGSLVFSLPQQFTASIDDPAIGYSTRPVNDPVARLNRRIEEKQVELSFGGPSGYLRSVLAALDIPVSSQVLVFSETSLQAAHITKTNPRAVFFNDSVSVGWVPGTNSLEFAALDPEQGVIFYQLPQMPQEKPQFERGTECLQCHIGPFSGGVPGMLAMSMLPLSDDPNEYAQGWGVDHRTPIEDRWGGWYVTAKQAPNRHLGNVAVHHVEKSYIRAAVTPKLESVASEFDAARYPSPYSDVVAHLVLNHQVGMTDLLIQLGWEARIEARGAVPGSTAELPDRVRDLAHQLVDYLLFVDEATLPGKVEGSSGFAGEFSAKGPRDSQGRSLRDLDLEQHVFLHPCSYMIYTEAFDALPGPTKTAVYERMWEILSGRETRKAYVTRLSLAERQAVVEILRETKQDLPDYFQPGEVR